MRYITIALAKGRLAKQTMGILAQLGGGNCFLG